MTDLVALAMGLFLVPEFLLAGGETDPDPDELELVEMGLVVATVLIGRGATAEEALTSSVDGDEWWEWECECECE